MDPITDLNEFHVSKGAVASWFNENFEILKSAINSLISSMTDKLNADLSNLPSNYEVILQPSYTQLTYNSGGIPLEVNKSYYYTLTAPTSFVLPTSYDRNKYNSISVDILVTTFQQNVTFFQFNESVGWANPAFGIDRAGLYKLIIERQPFNSLSYRWTCSLSLVTEVAQSI